MNEPGTRLAEELSLLFDAVAAQAGPWLDDLADHDTPDSPCAARLLCPLCLVATLSRGEPADLAAQTLDRLADAVALLRAVLADRWTPGDAPHLPGFTPPPPPSGSRVQRIPVRRRPAPATTP